MSIPRNSEEEMDYNERVAKAQRDKSAFRAQTVSLSADKYDPRRISSYPKPIDD